MALLVSPCSFAGSAAPSPSPSAVAQDACHLGTIVYCALNPDVTPETIRETICVSGWTATIRPPASYTSKLKAQQIASEHLLGTAADYEEDHRVPLELGGAASDPTNLSPEPRTSSPNNSVVKDRAENLAKQQVCDQGADLRQVQADFVRKWLAPYPGYT